MSVRVCVCVLTLTALLNVLHKASNVMLVMMMSLHVLHELTLDVQTGITCIMLHD